SSFRIVSSLHPSTSTRSRTRRTSRQSGVADTQPDASNRATPAHAHPGRRCPAALPMSLGRDCSQTFRSFVTHHLPPRGSLIAPSPTGVLQLAPLALFLSQRERSS